jgi:hypothetical protein
MKKSKSKSKSNVIETIAAEHGVTARTVRNWKRDGAPLHDPAELEGWLLVNNRQSPVPPELKEEMAQARIRLVTGQAEKIERENKLRSHELIEFKLAEDFINHPQGVIFFGEHERLAQELPATLKGKTEVEINVEYLRQLELINKQLERAVDGWVAKNGQAEAAKP